MGSLLVVVAQVAGKVAGQAVKLGDQAASKAWPPAFLQDRALDPLDGTVGGRPSGPDEAVASTEIAQRVVEDRASELRAVVREGTLQTPAVRGQIGCDSSGQSRGLLGRRVERGGRQLDPDIGGRETVA